MTQPAQKTMMINRFTKFTLIILVWAFVFSSKAGAQTTDFRMRLSAKIQKEFIKNLKTGLEYEHRFDQYLTTFDKAFLEPSVSYDISKHFRAGVSYRLMYDQNKTRERSFEQRVSGFVRYDFSTDDFSFKLKTGLQYGFDDLTNANFSYDQKLINRNTIEVEYDLYGTKVTPFATYEFFYHINNPGGGIFNQWRFKAGSSYDISKHSTLSIYYLFENEFNVANPVDSNTLGFGYSYSF